jgi:hypothetical protein
LLGSLLKLCLFTVSHSVFAKAIHCRVVLQELILPLNDDGIPRFTEYYTVSLISVMPNDGLMGPTPTSGAVINLATANQSLTVLDHNFPNGLLQFSTLPISALWNSTRILPAIKQPQVIIIIQSYKHGNLSINIGRKKDS